MSLLRFVVLFLIATTLLGAICCFFEVINGNDTLLVPKFWTIFIFLSVITVIAYLISWFGLRIGGEGSVLIIMGPMVMKLLFSLVFVVMYLQKIRVNAVHFALEFFSLYFLFTVFEIYCLLCNLRDQNKKVKSPNR